MVLLATSFNRDVGTYGVEAVGLRVADCASRPQIIRRASTMFLIAEFQHFQRLPPPVAGAEAMLRLTGGAEAHSMMVRARALGARRTSSIGRGRRKGTGEMQTEADRCRNPACEAHERRRVVRADPEGEGNECEGPLQCRGDGTGKTNDPGRTGTAGRLLEVFHGFALQQALEIGMVVRADAEGPWTTGGPAYPRLCAPAAKTPLNYSKE